MDNDRDDINLREWEENLDWLDNLEDGGECYTTLLVMIGLGTLTIVALGYGIFKLWGML